MLVYNKQLLFNMHGMNIKVKIKVTYCIYTDGCKIIKEHCIVIMQLYHIQLLLNILTYTHSWQLTNAETFRSNFTFMWPCIVTSSFLIKPTKRTNFQNFILSKNSTRFRHFLCP